MIRRSPSLVAAALVGAAFVLPVGAQQPPAVETATVTLSADSRVVTLPGELVAYQSAVLYARVNGFVDTVSVDRGTNVHQGQTLATLSVPEMLGQLTEAQSKVQQAEARQAEADARLATATSMLERLRRAADTPGAVAGLDLVRAEEDTKGARAAVASAAQAVEGAKAALASTRALDAYRAVTAPFSGRITERLVHPGALVGPSASPLFRLEQISRLRLVVPVPEHELGQIQAGRVVEFHVPAYPSQSFSGKIARSAGSLDARTRTLAVEIDVANAHETLAPGMFPDVSWAIVRATPAMLVPGTAVVTTTERTFVIRVKNGVAEWVTVKKRPSSGTDQVEVTGALSAGDVVVRRGTDEIRTGARVVVK
jgi:membrane fusion protein (multidrug efflux system)